MATTLSGDNSFALNAALNQVIDKFVEQYGELGLERLDGQESSIEQIAEALQASGLFSLNKLVILREPGVNKSFVEQVEQLLNNLSDNTELVIVEPKVDKRLNYYKTLKKLTNFQEFSELDANALAPWLVESAKSSGGELSLSNARYLVERLGAQQQLLSNELTKLLLYNPVVTRDSIDDLTEQSPQSTIFELLEAAFAGHGQQMMSLYDDQRAQKTEPQQIIAMLAWQLHVLAIIKSAGERSIDQIAKEAKLNPFVLRRSSQVAKNLSLGQIKRLSSSLVQVDKSLKSRSIDPDEALKYYLLTLNN